MDRVKTTTQLNQPTTIDAVPFTSTQISCCSIPRRVGPAFEHLFKIVPPATGVVHRSGGMKTRSLVGIEHMQSYDVEAIEISLYNIKLRRRLLTVTNVYPPDAARIHGLNHPEMQANGARSVAMTTHARVTFILCPFSLWLPSFCPECY